LDFQTLSGQSLVLQQTKLGARKQRHCLQKASAGKEFYPEILLGFRKMGRAARAPGRAPLHRNTAVRGEGTFRLPGLRNETCLMIFARNALASGPGMA